MTSDFCMQVCELWGKSMKQQKTTILIALLSLVSFCLGHSFVEVKTAWDEPVVIWYAVVLKTGSLKFNSEDYSKQIS